MPVQQRLAGGLAHFVRDAIDDRGQVGGPGVRLHRCDGRLRTGTAPGSPRAPPPAARRASPDLLSLCLYLQHSKLTYRSLHDDGVPSDLL